MSRPSWSFEIDGVPVVFLAVLLIFGTVCVAASCSDARIGTECVKAGGSWDGHRCEAGKR